MEVHEFNGYKFNKRVVVNKGKSRNIFAKLSYRQLQDAARELNLPVNFKHKVLLALVIAKTVGRNDIVNVIFKSKLEEDKIKLNSDKSRSRERHVGQSISTPNEESNILKKENAHNNDTTISSNQSLANLSINETTGLNHADCHPTVYPLKYSSSSSDRAEFSSADDNMINVLLASNGNIFPQENEADMSLFLSESSFGSENNAFCDFGSGASDYLNIFNEPNSLDDGYNDLSSILLRS